MVIGAIDETWQEKAGEATAGVKRQYLGCPEKVANGINTVHLSYVRDKAGHALIGARLIRAAGLRWPVEDFAFGKDCSGLAQCKARLYTAMAQ